MYLFIYFKKFIIIIFFAVSKLQTHWHWRLLSCTPNKHLLNDLCVHPAIKITSRTTSCELSRLLSDCHREFSGTSAFLFFRAQLHLIYWVLFPSRPFPDHPHLFISPPRSQSWRHGILSGLIYAPYEPRVPLYISSIASDGPTERKAAVISTRCRKVWKGL